MEIPITSLTKEFKCAKARLERRLSESRNLAVWNVSAGKKWNQREAVLGGKKRLLDVHEQYLRQSRDGGEV